MQVLHVRVRTDPDPYAILTPAIDAATRLAMVACISGYAAFSTDGLPSVFTLQPV